MWLFYGSIAHPIVWTATRLFAPSMQLPQATPLPRMACVGLSQVKHLHGEWQEEPPVVTLGNYLDGIRRLTHQGQTHYWMKEVVADIRERISWSRSLYDVLTLDDAPSRSNIL
jgi:hypothetical protein